MNIINSLFNPLHLRELGGVSTSAPKESKVEETGTNYRTQTQYVTNPAAALKLSAYFRAEELVSETVASLTMQYLRYSSTNGCYIKAMDKYRGSRLNYLLSTYPNPRQTAHQFWKIVVFCKRNYGNSFIYPVYRDGEVVALYALSPQVVNYDHISNTYSFADANLQIAANDVPAADFLHFRNLSARCDFWGQSIIHNAHEALTVAATLQEENKNRIATGGRMKGFLSFDLGVDGFANYADEQKKKALQELRQGLQDYDLNLLPKDGKFTPQSLSSADLQFIESEKFSIADISRYTGVPMSLLSDAAGSVYKSQIETFQIFHKTCIYPLLHEIETEMNAKLIVHYDNTETPDAKFEFDRTSLNTVDAKTEAEIDKILLESGVICPNELRAKHNLPPVAKGDIHYVSTNLAELGSDKLRGGSSVPGKDSNDQTTNPLNDDDNGN